MNSLDFVHGKMRKIKAELNESDSFAKLSEQEVKEAEAVLDTQLKDVELAMRHQLDVFLDDIVNQVGTVNLG